MAGIQTFSWSALESGVPVVLVCHASYELERSCHIAESLPDYVGLAGSLVVGTASTFDDDSNYRASWGRLTGALKRDAPANEILENRSNLMDVLRKAESALRPLSQLPRVVIVFDVSVFPRDRLWVLIDLVTRLVPSAQLVLTYTEPKVYNTEVSPNGWLSKGVVEVVSLPGFNGRQDPSKKSLLILNVGHENERVAITVNNREPHKLVLLSQGRDEHPPLLAPVADRIAEKLREDYGSIVNDKTVIRVDPRDYLAVRDVIRNVYDAEGDNFNVSVAFFGTKVQSVGALLACQENRRLEALYARPQLYHRESYSTGVSSAWMIRL